MYCFLLFVPWSIQNKNILLRNCISELLHICYFSYGCILFLLEIHLLQEHKIVFIQQSGKFPFNWKVIMSVLSLSYCFLYSPFIFSLNFVGMLIKNFVIYCWRKLGAFWTYLISIVPFVPISFLIQFFFKLLQF